ncbi:MAG TPA: hypothetical protein VFG72_00270 [Marmoricola sp.]|nr:hypothetical protein [Marmoricola sp.]
MLWAGTRAGVAPGKEWFASEHVLAILDSLLRGLDRQALTRIGRLHEHARNDLAGAPYADLELRLMGWSVVSAAGVPDLSLGGTRYIPPGLQRWSSAITSALTHRARMSAAQVTCLADAVRSVLPQLEQVLNEPVGRCGS